MQLEWSLFPSCCDVTSQKTCILISNTEIPFNHSGRNPNVLADLLGLRRVVHVSKCTIMPGIHHGRLYVTTGGVNFNLLLPSTDQYNGSEC
jgi:hypothetical protein